MIDRILIFIIYFVIQSTFNILIMTKQKEQLEALQEIRTLMERNSRFLSLSGLSGALAGIAALAGVAAIYSRLGISYNEPAYYQYLLNDHGEPDSSIITYIMVIAFLVLLMALGGAVILARRNAQRLQLPVWDNTAKRMLINLAIPLMAGGIYAAVLFEQRHLELIAPSTIIFYGLALLNAGKYTLSDIRNLGMLEIVTGLAATFYYEYGLLFWAFGFGVLHIIYGIMVYIKYGK